MSRTFVNPILLFSALVVAVSTFSGTARGDADAEPAGELSFVADASLLPVTFDSSPAIASPDQATTSAAESIRSKSLPFEGDDYRPVPEPASAFLVTLGLLGLAIGKRWG